MSDKLSKAEEAIINSIVDYTAKTRDTTASITGYNLKSYCTQNNGDCATCALSSYGKDCHNKVIVAKTKQSLYFDAADWAEAHTLLEKRETMAEFVRAAVRGEIERRRPVEQCAECGRKCETPQYILNYKLNDTLFSENYSTEKSALVRIEKLFDNFNSVVHSVILINPEGEEVET